MKELFELYPDPSQSLTMEVAVWRNSIRAIPGIVTWSDPIHGKLSWQQLTPKHSMDHWLPTTDVEKGFNRLTFIIPRPYQGVTDTTVRFVRLGPERKEYEGLWVSRDSGVHGGYLHFGPPIGYVLQPENLYAWKDLPIEKISYIEHAR